MLEAEGFSNILGVYILLPIPLLFVGLLCFLRWYPIRLESWSFGCPARLRFSQVSISDTAHHTGQILRIAARLARPEFGGDSHVLGRQYDTHRLRFVRDFSIEGRVFLNEHLLDIRVHTHLSRRIYC